MGLKQLLHQYDDEDEQDDWSEDDQGQKLSDQRDDHTEASHGRSVPSLKPVQTKRLNPGRQACMPGFGLHPGLVGTEPAGTTNFDAPPLLASKTGPF
jgi:hypothetical protein